MNDVSYWNKKKTLFLVRGISDKLLTREGIRYLLFFDVDREEVKEEELSYKISYPFRLFFTTNGFHAVGFGVHVSYGKKLWFESWKKIYPNSDFGIRRGTLRPASFDELTFITSQIPFNSLLIEPDFFDYYRDKKVFESLGV